MSRRQVVEYDDYLENTEAIEAYHAGWDAHKKGQPRPSEEDAAMGYDDRSEAIKVVVIMPDRAEGYYHTAPDA